MENTKNIFELFMPQSAFINYLADKYPEHKAPSKNNLNNIIARKTIDFIKTSYNEIRIDVKAYELKNNLISTDVNTQVEISGKTGIAILTEFLSKTNSETSTLKSELDTLKSKCTMYREQSTLDNNNIETLTTDNERLESNLASLKTQYDTKSEDFVASEKQNFNLIADIQTLKKQIEVLTDSNNEKDTIILKQKNQIKENSTTLDSYKESISTKMITIHKLQSVTEVDKKQIDLLKQVDVKRDNEFTLFRDKYNEEIRDLKDKIREIKENHNKELQNVQNNNILKAIHNLSVQSESQINLKK